MLRDPGSSPISVRPSSCAKPAGRFPTSASSKRAEAVGERFDQVISRAVSYEDLAPILKTLAENAVLLTGTEEPPPEMGFQWSPAVSLPWGEHRYLRTGRRLK